MAYIDSVMEFPAAGAEQDSHNKTKGEAADITESLGEFPKLR